MLNMYEEKSARQMQTWYPPTTAILVESVADKDDNTDDLNQLINNLPRESEAKMPEGDMDDGSHYSLISDTGGSSMSQSRGILTRLTDHPEILTSFLPPPPISYILNHKFKRCLSNFKLVILTCSLL